MNKKRIIKQAQIFAERQSKKNAKYIKKAFTAFANYFNKIAKQSEIIKALSEEEKKIRKINKLIDEALDRAFKPTIKKNLEVISRRNSDAQVDFFAKEWRREVDIIPVKSSVYNKTLKSITAGKVTNITETFEKLLNTQITKMAKSGESTVTIAKNIVRLSKGKIGRTRSLLIAREETHISLAISNDETAKNAKMQSKEWVYTFGAVEPRENHLAINGEKIGIDDYFDLGTEQAQHPKDHNLSAGESINCYCLCFYHREKQE